MLANRLFLITLLGLSSSVYGAGKAPSLQAILAEVEDTSSRLHAHHNELAMISERLDEQDTKLQQLSSTQDHNLPRQVQRLETDQKALAKTLAILSQSVQDIRSSVQNKLQEIQQEQKKLAQNLRALRNSLQALVDGSSPENYIDFLAGETPEHIHVVKQGETLSKIASKYNIPVVELKKLNKLNSDTIFTDQRIRLPKKK
ncbi:LysM peptidoglycan-binding domain-containing protein [Chlamydia trachomatis]|uniref:LysM peptidoglycan-binding domain-containing protein n=1 Tax=Chlamydia trachomatis TaxID=813 RepID=UPI0001B46E0B|nr:LysM peptidoglycan-binding domain-containing protein [Chlamydia trachomatis]ADH17385.1 putative soluble transglycosylase [Chlamydia trachomatis E/150]ADH21079.1 putative soluble transglycosylase [Chlamydia trachomatis E/11023]AGR94034.1 putative soluble transglycosylase [Chlamydia trachomatis RC-F/69]AGR95880.1 putative soluble transglycosylase [Chlamydia trachomatis RC-F(s)/852]AGR99599.1 putative soluble transglycosylase [Chlamydia trachomatis RC-F(s)/342]